MLSKITYKLRHFRRVLSRTSNTNSSIRECKKSSKKDLMSEEQQLANEIGSLHFQIENLKAAVRKLQEEAERKEVALAEIAREKERITLDLLRQTRSNSSLVKQLEEERKFYFEEKEQYCQEMNEIKKLKKALSSCSSTTNNEKSIEHFKKDIEMLKQILKQTTEANYNLSIKFLRMKNTKTCLKTELKTMQIEHEKLINDYKQKIENMASELNELIEDRLTTPISGSSKKYLHLVKQNSCLVYENLCLQLEVDNLSIKYEKLKLKITKSETNSRLKYIKHEDQRPKHDEKRRSTENNLKKVRIKDETPEKLEKKDLNQPSTSKNLPCKEKILKIYERNQVPGIPSIKMITSDADGENGHSGQPCCSHSNNLSREDNQKLIKKKAPSDMETVTNKPLSKLTLFQVSNVASRTSTASSEIIRSNSSPELFQLKRFRQAPSIES